LILQGPQGIGKSEFFKRLASPQWFDDSLGNLSDKDERLKLHKVWFVEWAELESVFRRKDLASVKSFLTSTSDLIRPPYGRAVQRFNRASVIVGSTNQDEFLADTTGNRRFLIVPCHRRVETDLLLAERDLIWCAAVAAYRLGETSELSHADKEESKAESQEYLIRDPWEDAILIYAENRNWVTVAEVLDNAIHLDLEKRSRVDEMRVSGILKGCGYSLGRMRVGDKALRVWRK
jgi:predicted P-loop ATPase